MQIGCLETSNNVFAAPMAGVSDKAFRILAREGGCGLVYTEMISSKALLYQNLRTLNLMDLTDERKPLAVQIFGSDPEEMARAAAIAEAYGADLIDINMGCPTPKIVNNGEGAALMQRPARAGAIVQAVARAVRVPVTVKMRKGWDENQINAPELAQRAEGAGAAAVTVHGRTRMQFYSGQADWDIIRQVVHAVRVPVIGNGDIKNPQDGARMLQETGCAGIMIGRAALGNPWVFRQVLRCLAGGSAEPPPATSERIAMARRHLYMAVEFKGEHTGVREMRKHLAWYLKGLPGAARIREMIMSAVTLAGVEKVLDSYESELEDSSGLQGTMAQHPLPSLR